MENTAICAKSRRSGLVLVRGSQAATFVIESDRVRYNAAREFRFFRGSHLPGWPPRLPRAEKWMS